MPHAPTRVGRAQYWWASAVRSADGKDTVVHTALRQYVASQYVSKGIAIVGASVIAVAPLALPPPQMPSVEVVAADVVRPVTVDVELTALVDLIAAVPAVGALMAQAAFQVLPLPAEFESFAMALANAGVPAVTETFKLFTETIPQTAQNLIATGQFAHLGVLAWNTAYLGVLTPVAPFVVAVIDALPMPIGTQNGVISEFLKLGLQTPAVTVATVLSYFAQIIDDGLSPIAALTGSLDAVSTGFTSALESIGKIVAALAGALPIADLAPPETMNQARTLAAAPDLPAADDTSAIASIVNSAPRDDTASAVAVKSATPTDTEEASTAPSTTETEPSEDDVTTNGATDLTDGNKAEPGDTVGESAGEGNDAPATEEDTTADEDAPGDQPETTAETSAGSNEGSVDDKESSAESESSVRG
jgi:hypothetical protein